MLQKGWERERGVLWIDWYIIVNLVYCRRRIDESFDDTDDEQDNDETESDDTDDALQLFVEKGREPLRRNLPGNLSGLKKY